MIGKNYPMRYASIVHEGKWNDWEASRAAWVLSISIKFTRWSNVVAVLPIPKNLRWILKPRLGLQFKDHINIHTFYHQYVVLHTTSSTSYGRNSSWLYHKAFLKYIWVRNLSISLLGAAGSRKIWARRRWNLKKKKFNEKKYEPLALLGEKKKSSFKNQARHRIANLFDLEKRSWLCKVKSREHWERIGDASILPTYNERRDATMRDLYSTTSCFWIYSAVFGFETILKSAHRRRQLGLPASQPARLTSHPTSAMQFL